MIIVKIITGILTIVTSGIVKSMDERFMIVTNRMESERSKRMADVCTDNRFELIAKYKAKLVEATNIETDKAEMDVIDNVLFRIWQMGWLDTLEQVVRCKDCKWWDCRDLVEQYGGCERPCSAIRSDCWVSDNWFCADGERKDGQSME